MSSISSKAKQTKENSDKKDATFNNPPWPEWSDSIAKIAFEHSGSKTAKPAGKNGKTTANTRFDSGTAEFEDGWSKETEVFGKYVMWKKSNDIENLLTTLVSSFDASCIDLVTSNSHLIDSMSNPFIKEIVESISCLCAAAARKTFIVEFQNNDFKAPPGLWKPWHHVYSKNMAGSVTHAPTYNPFGKYLVRLYFLGKWRRIEVDDYIPTDAQGNILVPVSHEQDLWLPILTKALLRVITLCKDSENISVITALTGWVRTVSSFRDTDENEVWNVCCSHLLKENDLIPGDVTNDLHCSYHGGFCLNDGRHLQESQIQTVFVFARITELVYNLCDTEPLERKLLTYLQKVSQNWIDWEDFSSWKKHRWFDWAYKHNIINGKLGDVFKTVDVYSPMWFNDEDNGIESLQSGDVPRLQTFKFKNWDFEKFIKFVDEVEIYYLPSQFEFSFKSDNLSNFEFNALDKQSITRKLKSDFGPKMNLCVSFYLLTDSLYCKRIYLSMMFNNFVSIHGIPMNDEGYIMCEEYHWQDDTLSTQTFFVKSNGMSTRVIAADPGRRTYRFWCNLPNDYCFQVFSNSYFIVDKLENIQDLLKEYSLSYRTYGDEICECFTILMKTNQGSEDHAEALQDFMNSFYPTDLRQESKLHQNLHYRLSFDNLLEQSVADFIRKTDLSKSPGKLKVLLLELRMKFLNPMFCKDVEMELYNSSEAAKENQVKPGSKLPSTSLELYFDKPSNCISLLSILMSREKSFLSLYPFCLDDEYQIAYHDYKGKTEVLSTHPFAIPIRLILNTHSEEIIPCGIFTQINQECFRTCVYDVETGESIPVTFERNKIWNLRKSSKGFVILGISFNPNSSTLVVPFELAWKIRVVSSISEDLLHPCLSDQEIARCNFMPAAAPIVNSETIRGYYIPNASNLISKFLISTNQNDVVTLQISVNRSFAQIQVTIKNDLEQIVCSKEGCGSVLLPSIVIDINDEQSLTEDGCSYSGEIILKNNSWDLDDQELQFIEMVKESYIPFSDISSDNGIKKKKQKNPFQYPEDETYGSFWTVTMLTESKKDKVTKLKGDTSFFDNSSITNPIQIVNQKNLDASEHLRAIFQSEVSKFFYLNDDDEEVGPLRDTEKSAYYAMLVDQFMKK